MTSARDVTISVDDFLENKVFSATGRTVLDIHEDKVPEYSSLENFFIDVANVYDHQEKATAAKVGATTSTNTGGSSSTSSPEKLPGVQDYNQLVRNLDRKFQSSKWHMKNIHHLIDQVLFKQKELDLREVEARQAEDVKPNPAKQRLRYQALVVAKQNQLGTAANILKAGASTIREAQSESRAFAGDLLALGKYFKLQHRPSVVKEELGSVLVDYGMGAIGVSTEGWPSSVNASSSTNSSNASTVVLQRDSTGHIFVSGSIGELKKRDHQKSEATETQQNQTESKRDLDQDAVMADVQSLTSSTNAARCFAKLLNAQTILFNRHVFNQLNSEGSKSAWPGSDTTSLPFTSRVGHKRVVVSSSGFDKLILSFPRGPGGGLNITRPHPINSIPSSTNKQNRSKEAEMGGVASIGSTPISLSSPAAFAQETAASLLAVSIVLKRHRMLLNSQRPPVQLLLTVDARHKYSEHKWLGSNSREFWELEHSRTWPGLLEEVVTSCNHTILAQQVATLCNYHINRLNRRIEQLVAAFDSNNSSNCNSPLRCSHCLGRRASVVWAHSSATDSGHGRHTSGCKIFLGSRFVMEVIIRGATFAVTRSLLCAPLHPAARTASSATVRQEHAASLAYPFVGSPFRHFHPTTTATTSSCDGSRNINNSQLASTRACDLHPDVYAQLVEREEMPSSEQFSRLLMRALKAHFWLPCQHHYNVN
eukprot:CAMPEP_0175128888 /NCGR_PEP_ID=MMETSP0087-20121206/5173_1 /TAXON_ID=136419 /ORGANISM="Unknown Unknown, Strain D1" /LENGTH=706 /DNA_ID=CAMNT_0016410989 /DNA_START=29 /DNA_END=2149 /DNA_ORIENTATION=-